MSKIEGPVTSIVVLPATSGSLLVLYVFLCWCCMFSCVFSETLTLVSLALVPWLVGLIPWFERTKEGQPVGQAFLPDEVEKCPWFVFVLFKAWNEHQLRVLVDFFRSCSLLIIGFFAGWSFWRGLHS
jgi:hypothetical protein